MNTGFQKQLKEIDVEWQPQPFYVLEQNKKSEKQNYTLISSICLVIGATNLLEFL